MTKILATDTGKVSVSSKSETLSDFICGLSLDGSPGLLKPTRAASWTASERQFTTWMDRNTKPGTWRGRDHATCNQC